MKQSMRVVFHRAVYHNLNIFINIVDGIAAQDDVKKAHESAPDILTNGRTLRQIVLDDALDAFVTVMHAIPDKEIPKSFYKQMLVLRDGGNITQAAADSRLNKALADKRALPPGNDVKPPEFLLLLNEMIPPPVVQTLVNNWSTTVSNFGKLMLSDESIAATMKASSIVKLTNDTFSEMSEKIENRNGALLRITGKAAPGDDDADEDMDEFEDEDGAESPLAKLAKRIKDAGMPPQALKRAQKEFDRLRNMNPQSSEFSVLTNYLDVLTSLPWNKASDINHDLKKTEEILNEDHYGMQKVKDAISEHVAVQNRLGKTSGQIMLLVGPPGVGKTSIARSVAKATGREYVRMSLGGIDDEAKIRGHKMTYVGAMPGDVVKALIQAGTKNPLIVLDEIDKLGRSTKGDPTAALLEALDPEQNHTFKDHYVDVEFDLSNVMFFCTANEFWAIPEPLRDRMEVIHLPGYLHDEKFEIAKRYLAPKQMKSKGLKDGDITIEDAALHSLINEYTQEAGVRQLERVIGKVCRKAVVEFAKGRTDPVVVTAANLADYAGVSRIKHDRVHDEDKVGIVNGLAYTSVGGCRLPIQTVTIPAHGFRLIATGKLGEVMRESIIVAEGLVKTRAKQFGISEEKLNSTELRLHAPEGAIPKDGPSAGLAMTTVIVSALTGLKIRHDVAMTGEVDLDGNAMKIGGLPEKLEGALRAGVKTVIIPKDNVGDLADVPDKIKSQLKIIPVSRIEEVLEHALAEKITPIAAPVPRNRDVPTEDEIRRVFNWFAKQAGNDNTPPVPQPEKKTGTGPAAPAL